MFHDKQKTLFSCESELLNNFQIKTSIVVTVLEYQSLTPHLTALIRDSNQSCVGFERGSLNIKKVVFNYSLFSADTPIPCLLASISSAQKPEIRARLTMSGITACIQCLEVHLCLLLQQLICCPSVHPKILSIKVIQFK